MPEGIRYSVTVYGPDGRLVANGEVDSFDTLLDMLTRESERTGYERQTLRVHCNGMVRPNGTPTDI